MHRDAAPPSLGLMIGTQGLLAALFVVGAGTIAILPGVSASLSVAFPEYAGLRAPLLALSVALCLLGLVALGLVARLVHEIWRGTVLRPRSLLWVDGLIYSAGCAALLVVTGAMTIGAGGAGNPALALALAAAFLGLIALACITATLRALLRHAIHMGAELQEVI